jgi:23S rRNA (pseudouridine1915-N3)-methyltransferase
MRWHIIAVGKPKLAYARLGVEEYIARLRPFGAIEIVWLKNSTPAGEGLALLERSKTMFRVVLDERGTTVTSRALAKKLAQWELHGPRDFALVIGGADGLSDDVRTAAGWLWSLSPLTLQHELALVVALEQLYRAYSIKAGLPYHRD